MSDKRCSTTHQIRAPMNGGGGGSISSHNFSTVDPMSKLLWFSESLENYLLNDVFQSKISFCPFSALDHGLLFMVSPNWQILLSLEYQLWWYRLKGLFVSFQKNMKFLIFDPQNSSYGSWKIFGSKIKHFMIFWKLRKKWYHQSSYLRDKSIYE